MNHPKDIPVTPEEEIYWQEIGDRIEIVNQNLCLFTCEERTWHEMDWRGA